MINCSISSYTDKYIIDVYLKFSNGTNNWYKNLTNSSVPFMINFINTKLYSVDAYAYTPILQSYISGVSNIQISGIFLKNNTIVKEKYTINTMITFKNNPKHKYQTLKTLFHFLDPLSSLLSKIAQTFFTKYSNISFKTHFIHIRSMAHTSYFKLRISVKN